MTRYELFAGSGNPAMVRTLLDALFEVDVDRGVAEAAGAIRRDHGLAGPDAIIAAIALRLGLPMVTRNTRHFRGITGLVVRTTLA